MKRLRWPVLIVLAALAVIVFILRNQQTPSLLPEAAPVQPVSGGVYSEALIGSPGRLNPLLDHHNPVDRDVNRLLYSGLIRFDAVGLPQADLAESWGISHDGTIYNFSIRPNATWHDGKPVTSEDIVFTVELLRNEGFPIPADLRQFWNEVEVKGLDEKTLQFILPQAFAPFLDYLTFGVLPKHLLESVSPEAMAEASFNLSPVGSGPFAFDRFIVENGQIQGVVLNAYPNYYNERAFIDQVVFRYYADAPTALEAYRAGTVLGISEVTPDILDQVLKEPGLNLYTGRQPQLALIYLNLDNPELAFFQDASIRRALLMGLNRQSMIDRIINGQAIIADGPIFPGTWAFYEGIERIGYDPEAALKQIRAAGYTIPASGGEVREKDGVRLSFELAHPNDAIHTRLAEAVQRDWARLGVAVTIKAVSYDELVQDYLEPRAYQAALVDLNLSRFPDPDPYPFWNQAQITSGQNYAQWNDRLASEYLEQARVTVDFAERAKAYRNFQVRFVKEMPALPLYFPVYSYAVDEQVQGVRMGPLFDTSDRFATILSWYLRAQRANNIPATSTATP